MIEKTIINKLSFAYSDAAGRGRVLNILLLGLVIIASVLTLVFFSFRFYYTTDPGLQNVGESPLVIVSITLFFWFLLFLSLRGHTKVSAYLFVALLFGVSLHTVSTFGADLPQGLLMFALTILISGFIMGAAYSISVLLFSVIALSFVGYSQITGLISVNTLWKGLPLLAGDLIAYILTLSIITLVAWLSNTELEKLLHRSLNSEQRLEKERDSLEIVVEERTQELKQAQLEQMFQQYRFIAFGRIAAGLFHDFASPLTSVSLNLENISSKHESDSVREARKGIERMTTFINAARAQMQATETLEYFSIEAIIQDVAHLLEGKAKRSCVLVELEQLMDAELYGDPLRFTQIMTNVIANAIDAYEGVDIKASQRVLVESSVKEDDILITVTDWGVGIAESEIPHIFEPFFTTKSIDRGTGLGLYLTHDFVTKDFNGTLTVTSSKETGTTFTIKLPQLTA